MGTSNREIDKLKTTLSVWGIAFLAILVFLIMFSLWYIGNLAKEIQSIAEMVNATGKVEVTIKRNNLLGADYLAIAIPVMVALAGALVTFLGMNRLSTFDERIDKIQKDLKEDLEHQTQTTRAGVNGKLKIEIYNQLRKQSARIDEREKEIRSMIGEASGKIDSAGEEADKRIKDTVSQFEKDYGWLSTIVQNNSEELDIITVSDAHRMVEELREKKPPNYMSMIQKIVERVCGEGERLSGDADDYHNLAVELASGYLYQFCLDVLSVGVHVFPKNTDLLADKLEYAIKGGYPEDAKNIVDKLLSDDSIGFYKSRVFWTWRTYAYIIDYYLAEDDLNSAQKICCAFLNEMPYDEHGYIRKAEILKMRYPGKEGLEKAINSLQEALNQGVNAPTCAQRLAIIYLDRGEYQNAINFASRAIQELAQGQPHIGQAHIISNRGFAYDRMFMEQLSQGKSNGLLAIKALQDYNLALSLTENNIDVLRPIQRKQILFRISVLKNYIPTEPIIVDTN